MAHTNYLIKKLQEQGLYRLVFIAYYGDWPHPCYFCRKEVDGHTVPYDRLAAVVHHIDHDETNHDPENLAGTHQGCHTIYHKKDYWSDPINRARQGELSRGRKPSDETRRKMRVAQQHRQKRDGPTIPTAEGRARISAANKGHAVTPQTRAKISAANLGRKQSATERARRSAIAKGKPKSASHRANIAAARRGKPSPFQGKHSPESIEKMRVAALMRPRASCIVCRMEMGVNNLGRHVCRITKPRKAQVRLAPEQQAEVFTRWQNGEKQVDLAAEYGVSQPYVSNIIRRLKKEGAAPS